MSHCTLNLRFHKLQSSTNAVIINKTDGCLYPGEVYASGNIIKVFVRSFFHILFQHSLMQSISLSLKNEYLDF